MTLAHSGLPDTDGGTLHDKGWNFSLDAFTGQFTEASRTKQWIDSLQKRLDPASAAALRLLNDVMIMATR
jgi:hypothetical protein